MLLFSQFDHHALGRRHFNQTFRLVCEELVKRLFDSRQDGIVMGDHDTTGQHARIEEIQACQGSLVKIHVKVR